MKISELVEKLMDIQAKEGDITVFYSVNDVTQKIYSEVCIVKVDKDYNSTDVILR